MFDVYLNTIHSFIPALHGFSRVLRHHSSLAIEDLGDLLTDGNDQTGVPILDKTGAVNPLWLMFEVETWKNETEFDVIASGEFIKEYGPFGDIWISTFL